MLFWDRHELLIDKQGGRGGEVDIPTTPALLLLVIRLTSLERMRYLTSRPLNTASVCESNSLAGVTVVVPAESK